MVQKIDFRHPELWAGKAIIAAAVIMVSVVAVWMGMSHHSLMGGPGLVLLLYSYVLFLFGVVIGHRISDDKK